MNTVREVDVDIGAGKYRIASDDEYLDHVGTVFEPDTVNLFHLLGSNADLALDVGANIGCTAIALGQLAKRVLAFEPSPTTFAFLDRNIQRSGLGNISIQNYGLGSEAGEYPLTHSPFSRAGAFVSSQVTACDGHDVETIVIRKMDQVINALSPPSLDLIKIDVEGFEGHVIRGATTTLSRYKPVVMLELNHWCLNAFQRTSVPDFLDSLRAIFPTLLAVDGSAYADLHDVDDSYRVMYHHILRMRYMTLVAAFDDARLADFRSAYRHEVVR